ncbi:DUF4863 family protein [Marinobacter sp.]|uniref:4-hydroxylaminobenzoate lyase n=1 Tax=Marinobacter sp. TaxID=50741 RepID=UPI00384C88F0
MSVIERLSPRLTDITGWLSGQTLTAELAAELTRAYPPDGEWCEDVERLCREGMENGELGRHEAGGIRFGRVFKPAPEYQGFSLDIVEMEDVKGPHHGHPNGEIDLVLPLDESARFDGHSRGWVVYPPDSAHHPTVTEGRAIVLYLLPEGAIEFSRA